MAQLIPNGGLKKVWLPSSANEPIEDDKGWAVIETGAIKAGDVLYMDASSTKYGMAFNMMLLAQRIKEWNIKDASGAVAEISLDTVKQLDLEDVTVLINELELQASEGTTTPLVPTTNAA